MLDEQTPGDRTAVRSRFELATRLASRVLLLAANLASGNEKTAPTVTLMKVGESTAAECRRLDLPSPGSEAGRCLLIVFIPGETGSLDREDSFAIRGGDLEVELSGAAIIRLETDPKTFARERLAPLEANDRARVLAFLAKAGEGPPSSEATSLSETLFALRQALRERLPLYEHRSGQPRGLSVNSILAVDDKSFYASGWLRDEEAAITRLTAVSPEGHRAELAHRLFRYPRPDVTAFFSEGVQSRQDPDERAGFVCLFELDRPSLLSSGWIFELENANGGTVEAHAPAVLRDPVAIRNQILADSAKDRLPNEELMVNHVMPAIDRIAGQIEAATRVASITTFGEPPPDPAVSIVVPLYKRIDLIEQQLSEFTRDPDVKQADLIYVLDSPEQADALLELVASLFPIYEVPLRIAVLQRNVGFANASNAGASIARGQLLLLMNSDVIPDVPGWLSRLASVYGSTPKVGALGPKLLYEDGSIQHAGMHFHQSVGSTLWQDAHFFRGLHRDFPDATVARQVPLVSGACLMISRGLYEDLGGLQARYVQGDYEDSDLCMRLRERGLQNWYTPAVELYHLEALSYLAGLRGPANRYNAWLHTHLWRRQIEQLVEEGGR